jgi:hypothetical protein
MVSEASQSGAESAEVEEILDAVPVLAEPSRITRNGQHGGGAIERSAASVMPAVQAAAVAAGGFVAGAAVVGLVHRRQRRSLRLAKGRRGAGKLGRGGASRRASRAGELVQIVGSRSLLLDVHLLGGPDGDR